MKKLTLVKLNKVIALLISDRVRIQRENLAHWFMFDGEKSGELIVTQDISSIMLDTWLERAEKVYYDNIRNANILSTDKLYYDTYNLFDD